MMIIMMMVMMVMVIYHDGGDGDDSDGGDGKDGDDSIFSLGFCKGHPLSADLRYGDEDAISPSTLIFAARKG